MVSISSAELLNLIRVANPHPDHPIFNLTMDADLEDAAQGGIAGTRKLRTRRTVRRISQEELRRVRTNVEKIGSQGEEWIVSYLLDLKNSGRIVDFEWVSKTNAIAPYDFRVNVDQNNVILIDGKTTTGEFDRVIHISVNELYQIANGDERYDIYRIYEMNDTSSLCEYLTQKKEK